MHPSFSNWYRITNIDPTEEVILKRWQGIEKIANNLDVKSALDLVRIFSGKSLQNKEFMNIFREAFREADQTFSMSGNDLELKILAGIAIIQNLDTNAKTNINTALATVCTCFNEPDTMPPFSEVQEIAAKHLVDKSLAVRLRQQTSNIKTGLANIKVQKDALLAAFSQGALPPIQEPMGALFDKIQQVVNQVISKINQITTEIDRSLLLQQEETEMLWWLMGEYSTTLNKRISSIPLPFACLIVAKELSGHTRIIPGPISIAALIDKMLTIGRKKSSEVISIKNVINKTPKEWKSKYLDGINLSGVEDLCPVHYAINKSVESGNNTSWIAGFEKNIGTKADQPVTALEISTQAYNEMLLLNSV